MKLLICIIMVLFPCFSQAKEVEFEYNTKEEIVSVHGNCTKFYTVHGIIKDDPNLPPIITKELQYIKCEERGKTKIYYNEKELK